MLSYFRNSFGKHGICGAADPLYTSGSNIPILIGGQALLKVPNELKNVIIFSKVRVMEKVQLDEILRLIREVIRHRK